MTAPGKPPPFIGPEIEYALNWTDAVGAIKAGHTAPRATLGDTLLTTDAGDLLTRSACVSGLGAGVKAATINPANTSLARPLPAVQGAFFLFEPKTGVLKAVVDGALLTRWKTVADSLAGAAILARPHPKTLAVIGTGVIADALIEGYTSYFPAIESVLVWGRSTEKATRLAAAHNSAEVVEHVHEALAAADIVTSATGTSIPIIPGDAVRPGAHVDLIGAYGPTMREADDALMKKARVFVDCFDTTIDHIGELMIPLRNGVIAREDVEGDLYDLCALTEFDRKEYDITLFKNGGGAHLDVMTALYLAECSDSNRAYLRSQD